MGLPEPQRFFIEELCARWNKTPEYVLELGISGELIIWAEFNDKFAVPESYILLSDEERNRKYPDIEDPFMLPTRFLFDKIESRPVRKELSLLRLNCGEATVKQVHCLHGSKDTRIAVATGTPEPFTFSLKNLFVRLEDVESFEVRHGLTGNQSRVDHQGSLSAKREKTLLKVIGALLSMKYQAPAYFKGGKVNATAVEDQFMRDLAAANFTTDGIKEGTIRKTIIKQAFEAIGENKE
ncbi:hypothetical protein Despr_0479 [Desulfobulbus propionicus DSM 2032]|uniref:Uncharacterized protein n=1 Tax=Desulfobulbus propionicus (strain ATCC 33891 / DSM 2032 / VKM B-1956 / 1pr3) TaxID=577650 RepID=A0A7U4DN49_DESPD|nr:hypothetical protein [Desulfobulbus propionicus]ADW16659.1 hypothetical protein Despr_0479 [Desulfobulbus propionicus DSM 2032]